MSASLSPARRDELIETIVRRVQAWGASAPALLLLEAHAPLAYLGSQLMFFAQPFFGLVGSERLARDLALLLEEPENVDRLIARLEGRGLRPFG